MISYYTTDTHELAPYPDMTADDLRDYETWADEMEEQSKETLKVFMIVLLISCLLFILAIL